MTVKEILGIALSYLGYSDDIDVNDNAIIANPPKELKTLLRCVNLVYNELAAEYLPLIYTEKIELAKKFMLSNLTKPIIDAIKLETNGIKLDYSLTHNELVCDYNGMANLTYSYIPNSVGFTDSLEYGRTLSSRTVALGVCAEYALINGLYNESMAFETRYKESLRAALSSKGDVKWKGRRWV